MQYSGNLMVNLNMYKVCYNILDYPEEECLRLGRYTDKATQALEKKVQPYAGTMLSIIEMVPLALPIVLSLMIGSWSDKYGRKPVLIIILLCQTLGFAISATMLSFKEINPWWLMVSAIPSVLCGGVMTFFTIILSYLNDTATAQTRALRMVTIDVIQIGTSLAGGLSSSYLLYATSYSSVYGFSTLLVATALVYAYFFCPESLQNKVEEKPTVKSLFQWNNLTEMFKVTFKEREHSKRTIILLIMFCQIILVFSSGESNVNTLYLRHKLEWTMTQKNNFGAWSNVLSMVCTIGSTYWLHRRLKLSEGALVIVSMASTMAGYLLFALANTDNYIYMSAVVGMFSGLAVPMMRSTMGKLILPEEMGKIYSLVTVINTIGMLVSSIGFQQIYNATLDYHPETYIYVSFALHASVIVFIVIIMYYESHIPVVEDLDKKDANLDKKEKNVINRD